MKFVVVKDCAGVVIRGMDVFCEYGSVIDLQANRLTFRKPVSTPGEPEVTSAAVRLADHVNLLPRSSIYVPVGTETVMCGKALLEKKHSTAPRKRNRYFTGRNGA